MDVAVTGASGLIGSALTRRLTASGHRVLELVRREPVGSDEARWAPQEGYIDSESLECIGAVVHLAGAGIGERRWTADQKELILSSRTLGTKLLATTLAQLNRPPRAWLSGSAIGYYGDCGDAVADETSPPGDDFLAEVCAAWERATEAAQDAGLRVTLLRSGIVLSSEGGVLARQLPFFRWGVGGRVGSGRQWQSWISIDDEVRAIEHLLEADVAGPVNLTSPNPVTNAELTRTLGRVLRRPTTITPKFALKLLYGSELTEGLLGVSQRVVPRTLQRCGFEFRHPDLEPALRHLLGRPPG